MLRDHPFARDEPMTGLEVELNLVDGDLEPALTAARCSTRSGRRSSRPSWAAGTSSSTCRPRPLPGDQWRHFEHQLLDELALARSDAQDTAEPSSP